MKNTSLKIRFACLWAALLLAACTADEPAPTGEGAIVCPTLAFGVSEMTMTAMPRAAEPMSPDLEKYVKTIAVFEFDNEGWHEKNPATYHFIDFLAGTVDGVQGVGSVKPTEFGIVETTLDGLKFEKRTDGTICLVANVTEEQVDDFYEMICRESGQSYGSMTFDQFKQWALPFEYEQAEGAAYDESITGHIRTMYMFGYYRGEIEPSEPGAVWVDLGRLASRLDITVVNETGADITERLGYHFDNVCHSAYLFPMKQGMPPTDEAGLSRTVICSGPDPVEGDEKHEIVPQTFPKEGIHTRYFYVAAHSAKGEEDATKLHLFYNRPIVGDDTHSDTSNSVLIPLCNVHPHEAASVANGYSLSRNTRYHFTIRLRKKAEAASGGVAASAAGSDRDVSYATVSGAAGSDRAVSDRAVSDRAGQDQAVAYSDRPGEITVYLP